MGVFGTVIVIALVILGIYLLNMFFDRIYDAGYPLIIGMIVGAVSVFFGFYHFGGIMGIILLCVMAGLIYVINFRDIGGLAEKILYIVLMALLPVAAAIVSYIKYGYNPIAVAISVLAVAHLANRYPQMHKAGKDS